MFGQLCFITLSIISLLLIGGRVESGFYLSMMQRGGTPCTYTLGHIFVDMAMYFLVGLIFWAFLTAIDIGLSAEIIVPVMLYAVAEPLFIHMAMNVFVIRGPCSIQVVIFLFSFILTVIASVGVSFTALLIKTGPDANGGIYFSYAVGFLPSCNFIYSFIFVILRQTRAIQKGNLV